MAMVVDIQDHSPTVEGYHLRLDSPQPVPLVWDLCDLSDAIQGHQGSLHPLVKITIISADRISDQELMQVV